MYRPGAELHSILKGAYLRVQANEGSLIGSEYNQIRIPYVAPSGTTDSRGSDEAAANKVPAVQHMVGHRPMPAVRSTPKEHRG
jgi:hypothetical protein